MGGDTKADKAPAKKEGQTAAPSSDKMWANLAALPQNKKSEWALRAGLALAIAFILALIIVVNSIKKSTMGPKQPVVVFMDGDPTDFVGLRYLIARGDVDLRAIVLAGNGWSQSLQVLQSTVQGFFVGLGLAAEQIPPMYSGQTFSCMQSGWNCTMNRAFDPRIRVANDLLWGSTVALPQPRKNLPASQPYFGPVRNILRNSGIPVLLINLGPLSDLAEFLKAIDKSLFVKIRSISVEGGVFERDKGNVAPLYNRNTQAELNFFFDPVAGRYVVQRKDLPPLPLSLFPLEASRRCSVDISNALLKQVTNGNPWLDALLTAFAQNRPDADPSRSPLLGPLYTAIGATTPGDLGGLSQIVKLIAFDDLSDYTQAGKVRTTFEGQPGRVVLRYDCNWVKQHLAVILGS
jgi:inosine-uridine nucleoside N-ribohydrolase